MKKVIIINGTGGSGKDTFVEFCQKYGNIENISSIDFIKDVARYAGWSGEKDEKSRKMLSDLKELFTNYNEAPLKDILNKTKEFINGESNVLFIHIREAKEIMKTKSALEQLGLNVQTLLIKRKGLENIASNKSDAEVENYNYDEIILNDTLEGLNFSAENFIKKMSLENGLKKTI